MVNLLKTVAKTTSRNDAPPAPNVPASTGSQQSVLDDPYNLALQGYGDLRNVTIPGAAEFFGLPTQIYTASGKAVKVHGKRIGQTSGWPLRGGTVLPATYTATQAIQNFTHMTGAQLADAQDRLYRAGYYSANYTPDYGKLHAEDISAFRLMIIGLASNPANTGLGQYLTGAAQDGTARGLSGATGKTIQLTNPDDLRLVLQKSAQDLYGGNLPEDDVQKFIQTFQSMESSAQSSYADQQATKGFQAGLYNPATGQAQGSTGSTAVGVAAPSATTESQMYVKQNYPNQVAATQFGHAMEQLSSKLGRPFV